MYRDEERLLSKAKEAYECIAMSDGAYQKMRMRMGQAREENKKMKKNRTWKIASVAAAAALALVLLPNMSGSVAYAMENIPILGNLFKVMTFRDYQYEDERHMADIQVPEITTIPDASNEPAMGKKRADNGMVKQAQKSAEEINAEIKEITDGRIAAFEADLNDEGYKDVEITSEVLNTTSDYFTLKLICFVAEASGYEMDYYYTIDLNTGERLALSDLFIEGSDYKKMISDIIKRQMAEQMAADGNISYWLDDPDFPEDNFNSITDETSFYVNEDGEIVISFNEGDVAPMYMGVVEFTIPNEEIADIRKR